MASVWEIAIKSGLKKLTLSEPFEILLPRVITIYSLNLLPITVGDCAAYERFAFPDPKHRDPSRPNARHSSSTTWPGTGRSPTSRVPMHAASAEFGEASHVE